MIKSLRDVLVEAIKKAAYMRPFLKKLFDYNIKNHDLNMKMHLMYESFENSDYH